MPSAIDPTKPVAGSPTTQSVRDNFAAAKSEIEILQQTAGVGPEGPEGPRGPSGTIAIGTVNTGNPGTNATVTNSGTPTAAVFNFLIPRGDMGTGGSGITETQAVDAVRHGAVRFEEIPATNAGAWPTTPNAVTGAPTLGSGWVLQSGSGATGTYRHTAGNSDYLSYPATITQNDWYQIVCSATRTSPIPIWGDQELYIYFGSAPGSPDHGIKQIIPGSGQAIIVVQAPGNYSYLIVEPGWDWAGNFTLTRIARATTAGNSRTFYIRDFSVTSRGTNLMLGSDAGRWLTPSGSNNILIGGRGTGTSLTAGNNNTALGDNALSANGSSSFHTAIGYHALREHMSGSNATVAVGVYCLTNAVNTNHMVAIGPNCMTAFQYGSHNTAVGSSALGQILIGDRNVALGHSAGMYEGSGNSLALANDCIYIGSNNYAAGQDPSHEIVIGNDAYGHGSNTITLGDDNLSAIYANVQTISALSDSRVKSNIQAADLDTCVNAVRNLPVSRWAWQPIAGAHNDRNVTGFLAEDIAKLFPKSVTRMDTSLPVRDENGNRQMVQPSRRPPRKLGPPEENGDTGDTGDKPPLVPKTQKFEGLCYVQPTELLPTLWGAVQRIIQQIEELQKQQLPADEPKPAVDHPKPPAEHSKPAAKKK